MATRRRTPDLTAPATKVAAKKVAAKKAPAKRAAPTKKAAATQHSGKSAFDRPSALEDICDRIENGEMMAAIAKRYGVHKAQLTRWIGGDPERKQRVDAVRTAAADSYAEEADRGISQAKNAFQLQKARERAHHLRWLAKMRNPRAYSDRLVQEHVGDGGGPVKTEAIVNMEAGEAYLRMLNGRP